MTRPEPAQHFETVRGRRHILVVDDNLALANAIECTLAFAGHQVTCTSDSGDIFALLAEMKPDLLITDVIIPDMDTIDLIGELRQSHWAMKIIAISGNPYLLRLAAQHGADRTLAKPFDLRELSKLVDATLI